MSWKEFLKPDWKKILLTIIFASSFLSLEFMIHSCPLPPSPCPNIIIFRLFWIYEIRFSNENFILPLILTVLFVYYLTACLIVWIYNKVKKK